MSNPKLIGERLERFLKAWHTLAPNKSFGGMTLPDFERETLTSVMTRELVEELQDKLKQALATRDAADEVTANKMQLVVAGVLADPTEGADSAIYEAFGYTRKSEYRSGLTRRRTLPVAQ